MSVCQTGDTEDFLRVGRAIGDAIADDRPQGACSSPPASLSHTFYPLRELRDHEAERPDRTSSAAKALRRRPRAPRLVRGGRHDRVLDTMAEFLTVRPEGKFAHYLMMAARARRGGLRGPRRASIGDYENSIGTSQVHVWFDRPADRLDAREGACCMTEYRRILLDGVRRPGRPARRRARRRRRPGRWASTRRIHLPPVRADEDHRRPPQLRSSRTQEFMTKLPPAPTYFHKPITALNSPQGRGRAAGALQVAELRGRDRHRHRPHLPQRLARGGRRLHRRLHRRQRLRPARLPRHRRRLDAAGQGLATRSRPIGPGLVTDWDFHDKTLRTLVNGDGRAGGDDRRDGVGHALPRRRHRPHHHAGRPATSCSPARRRTPATGLPRRRRRGRGRGPRHA